MKPTTREYVIANLFDGDDGGTVSASIAVLADDIAELVDETVAEYRKALVARVREAMDEEPRMYTEIFLALIEQDTPPAASLVTLESADGIRLPETHQEGQP